MRRSMLVLSTLLLVSLASAQLATSSSQCDAPKPQLASQHEVSLAPTCPIIQGQPNYIPLWVNALAIGSSVMYQDPNTKNIGVGTKTPVATLDVNGNANVATTYQIGGGNVVSVGLPVNANLFLGLGAGANDIANQGITNTFVGSQAGLANDVGYDNTFSGSRSGTTNTGGTANTFTGASSGLFNSTGNNNVFTGAFAGWANSTGSTNTFTGYAAGKLNTAGGGNTFDGYEAGANTTGNFNTFVGYQAGFSNATGSQNIYIANQGPGASESNTVRIGDANQSATYIAGVFGATASSGVQVYVNSSGQLGTLPSSGRFKEQIRDLADSSSLMKLRPVSFYYKPEYDSGPRTLQYGLIAEEVVAVDPNLVAYGADGKPYTVKYQYLTVVLLNMAQQQYRRAEAEAQLLKEQRMQMETLLEQTNELRQRLTRLESAAPAPGQSVEAARTRVP